MTRLQPEELAQLLRGPAEKSTITPLQEAHDLRTCAQALAEIARITGPATAIAACADWLCRTEPAPVDILDSLHLSAAMDSAGWFQHAAAAPASIFDPTCTTLKSLAAPKARAVISQLLTMLGFHSEAPVAWLTRIFETVIFTYLQREVATPEDIDGFLWTEALVYDVLVKQVESADHYKSIYRIMTGPLQRAGEYAAKPPPSIKHPKTKSRVGFVFRSGAMLAHAVNYTVFLRGLKGAPSPRIEPVTLIVGPEEAHTDSPLKAAVRELGFDVMHPVPYPERAHLGVMDWVSETVENEQLDALVFVTQPVMVTTYSSARIAPCMIWWAMKYHYLEAPNLNGRITFGALGQNQRFIGNHKWQVVKAALPDLLDPTASGLATKFRTSLKQQGIDLVLGCLGREEKLLNPDYLDAIADLLHAYPTAAFLWSGRKEHPAVRRMMKERGISNRCPYLGWINTKIMVQVFDIYLDSFPFASGHTAYEAMAAGCPVVVLITPESRETSTASQILPALEGDIDDLQIKDGLTECFSANDYDLAYSPYQYSVEDYKNYARRLIADVNFRKQAGQAGKDFIDRYLSDVKAMGQDVTDKLSQIIENTHSSQ